jgi:carbamoyltransferase
MNVLSVYPLPGIYYAHDPNASVVTRDGVCFAVEEERFLRSQYAIGHVSERAALYALRAVGIGPRDVDLLVTTSLERCRRRSDYRYRLAYLRELMQIAEETPSLCVPHHLAHAALAVFTSGWDSCAFLTADGGGDGAMLSWGVFSSGRFRMLGTAPLSPAPFFTYVASLCGFSAFEEGKVMGLAAYGRPHAELRRYFERHFRVPADRVALESDLAMEWSGRLRPDVVDPDTFRRSKYLEWRLAMAGEPAPWIADVPPQDIARTGQEVFTDLMMRLVANIVALSGQRSVACAGGAFHNVVANATLARADRWRIHIPVAPHDAGLSIGAGLWARHINGHLAQQPALTPYLGPAFEQSSVQKVLDELLLEYRRPQDFAGEVAAAIAAGRVVGWFVGRSELGARALGARSVLADPRDPQIRARVNQLLKKRDWFMPYAPSILEEHGHDYFEDFKPGQYMHLAFRARPGVRERVPGAIHVDDTCRAHAVDATSHPAFRAVIEAFYSRTGVPMVLNTSFNRHGVPMVATPRQAAYLLIEGCVDVLAIEGFIVESPRKRTPGPVLDDAELLASMRAAPHRGH